MACTTLADATAQPDFFASLAALAMRLHTATDGADAAGVLQQAAQAMGADAAAFASIITDDESCESYRFVLACEPTWCMEYEGQACYMHDPWLEYAKRHTEPVVAEHIACRTDRERAVVALAQRFGFRSAIVVPCPAPRGLTRVGALCIGSSADSYFAGAGVEAAAFAARAIAMPLHDWLVARLRDELIGTTGLTPDEVAMLQHERLGHGTKHIAQELNLSAMAIDSRWQRLKAKLGVSSRSRAALLAAEFGLI